MKRYPLVVLSHRKDQFIENCLISTLRLVGAQEPIIVDDSGDPAHHWWLDKKGLQFSVVDPQGNAGYLSAMRKVWEVARTAADQTNSDYVMLWEEDFMLRDTVELDRMAMVMDCHPDLSQLNLQRQKVYRVEHRFGYMESHQRRGYRLERRMSVGPSHEAVPWVSRALPFTTNPGLIRRSVLDIDWPSRAECDQVSGGAEPAMSQKLISLGYNFGWLGEWDSPVTEHVGDRRKTGVGY